MLARVEAKIFPEPNSGCWLWSGACSSEGYGNFGTYENKKYKTQLVHRYVYEEMAGKIPTGLQLDHKCRTPQCCNPSHLEPVTSRENTKRGMAGKKFGAKQSAKTHCPSGHQYTQKNTINKPSGRHCRECHKLYMRNYNQRKKGN